MSLTKREKAILLLAAQGFKNGAIGRRMGLSVRMVIQEFGSIQEKLDALDRASAVAAAILGDVFNDVEKRIIKKRIVLSQSEFVVLGCLTGDKTASEVSRILRWPERTVRNRVTSLKGKWNIATREEARNFAACFSYLAA